MERKFRLGLMLKEAKRLWWLGAAILAIIVIVIIVYSTALYTPTATVEGGEFVFLATFNSDDKDSSSVNTSRLNDTYMRINGQSLKNELNARIKAKDPSITNFEGIYKLAHENFTYNIRVTMPKKEDAIEIVTYYIDYVKAEIASGKYNSGTISYESDTYQAPVLKSEVGLTPIKMSAFGLVGAAVVYAVILLCVFYFNRKLYNGCEFQDNFKATVLENNVRENGYGNVAIKLTVQSVNAESPYIVALAKNVDMNAFAEVLKKEGFTVLTSDIDAVLSEDREVRPANGLDVLFGTNGVLKSSIACNEELKKTYRFDYILISATGTGKDYVTAASIADGLILGFDLKRDSYKKMVSVFEELSIVKDLRLLGVVL